MSIFSRRVSLTLPSFTLYQNAAQRCSFHSAPHPMAPMAMPRLAHLDTFSECGVSGLFSKKAFNTSWTEYQSGLVDNLNRLISGTEYSGKTPLDIAIMTSRQADLAATFNYASQAHNNHFFFETLSPVETSPPEPFLQLIPHTFSSLAALKTEMLTTALKMFGSGWVWLVLDQNKFLRILCTYNAGTPYSAAHRRQNTDMNTHQTLAPTISGITTVTRNAARGPGNNWAVPLLNINVWEHAWLEDFGIGGKANYLEAVWKAIDWDAVNSRGPYRGNSVRIMYSA